MSNFLTLIPCLDGQCATWDVTVTDTVAPSYHGMSSACEASAAEAAAKRKKDKYIDISIISFPFESFGPINLIRTEAMWCSS